METKLNQNELNTIRILRDETSSEKPMSGKELTRRIGLMSNAAPFIYTLHLKGYPICSKGKGYFYAHNGLELEHYINRLERRKSHLEREIIGLKGAFMNVDSFDNNMKMGQDGKPKYYRTLPVRTPEGTIRYERFEVGSDGQAIIPEGTKLV